MLTWFTGTTANKKADVESNPFPLPLAYTTWYGANANQWYTSLNNYEAIVKIIKHSLSDCLAYSSSANAYATRDFIALTFGY